MAGKEHQGLQIALIIFVLITIALAATSFIFYKEWEKQVNIAEAAKTREQEEIKISNATEDELTLVKTALGKDPDANVNEIKTEIENLMKQYSATYPNPAQTITAALENQMETFLALQAERVRHQDQIATLEDGKQQLQGQIASLTAKFDGDKRVQLATVLKVREEFEAARKTYDGNRAQIAKRIDEGNANYRKLQDDSTRRLESLKDDLRDVKKDRDAVVKVNTDLKNTDLESPDGQITGISARQRMVWIDIGSADGLRRQTTFSVFDRDTSQITQDTPPKAKIEVIRLLDSHVAEARILEDSITDPILRNDVIFSTAFTPGQTEHFAVAGLIDIDGDGVDDLERLKSIISINGGELDAIVDAKGNRSGKPNYTTRFLIVGVPPKDVDAVRTFSTLLKDAEGMGIKTISVAKFLDYVGYVGRERSVDLGRRASSSNFKARPRDGVVRESNSAFKKRLPGGN